MKLIIFIKQLPIAIILLLSSGLLAANSVDPEQKADKIIEQLYHRLKQKPINNMPARIEAFSALLLGKPYLLTALGEGKNGEFDQFPLYRLDAFDCETYVDTVLALALANNLNSFKQCIQKIRYHDGQVNFAHRNHFASRDWNRNNQSQSYTKDITTTFTDEKNKPVAKRAKTIIDKPSWYQHFTRSKIRINGLSEEQKQQKLAELKQIGSKLEVAETEIPYLPLSELFNEKGEPNHYLFKQIPNASIIEIIRPSWDLRKQIGTRLHVSHLGFGIWVNDTLMYREASSIHQKTVDVPLVDYLRNTLKSPTIKGINVQIVVPKQVLGEHCEVHPEKDTH
ncbi:N-acetylmuramoyl-L-alanine amidase-like domain-containing protein [Legionella yabuuchiae]|uniref:N-acetylmuramoyl-L-alanine amidase-like domain-containing protein n=1 Tax=Legionella yabuuchiae TaxID=376727 RepID=UPI001054DA7A|nr:N-acetylmuramoyl-L-alanine amidase-like domain-containing protein [Legionella yabuuchiae]